MVASLRGLMKTLSPLGGKGSPGQCADCSGGGPGPAPGEGYAEESKVSQGEVAWREEYGQDV